MTDKITRSEQEWKELLTPEQYEICRKKGNWTPFQRWVLWDKNQGHIPLFVLWECIIFIRRQIWSRMRLAEFLEFPWWRQRKYTGRSKSLYAEDGGSLQAMRCAFGTRVWGWPGTDRVALLHQFSVTCVGGGRGILIWESFPVRLIL